MHHVKYHRRHIKYDRLQLQSRHRESHCEKHSRLRDDHHVHIIKPETNSNLGKVIGEAHRRYTRMINFRENWEGFLWQGRFSSYSMDECWLLKAAAYVELNPVKAEMVKNA